jgi:hypothetical protein
MENANAREEEIRRRIFGSVTESVFIDQITSEALLAYEKVCLIRPSLVKNNTKF